MSVGRSTPRRQSEGPAHIEVGIAGMIDRGHYKAGSGQRLEETIRTMSVHRISRYSLPIGRPWLDAVLA